MSASLSRRHPQCPQVNGVSCRTWHNDLPLPLAPALPDVPVPPDVPALPDVLVDELDDPWLIEPPETEPPEVPPDEIEPETWKPPLRLPRLLMNWLWISLTAYRINKQPSPNYCSAKKGEIVINQSRRYKMCVDWSGRVQMVVCKLILGCMTSKLHFLELLHFVF